MNLIKYYFLDSALEQTCETPWNASWMRMRCCGAHDVSSIVSDDVTALKHWILAWVAEMMQNVFHNDDRVNYNLIPKLWNRACDKTDVTSARETGKQKRKILDEKVKNIVQLFCSISGRCMGLSLKCFWICLTLQVQEYSIQIHPSNTQ